MARNVVCKICKTKGYSDNFYKVTDDNGRNKYYCNKEEYENNKKQNEQYTYLMRYIALEVLEYQDGQIVPPSMVTKIKKLHEFYGYEVIQECFRLNKDTIQYWIRTKDFSSEYGMVSYTMKIIEGSINGVYKNWKTQQEQQVKMNNMSIDVSLFNEVKINNDNINTFNNKKKDISMFLDEEDM